MTEEEALELIHFSNEGRKRVKDQLYIFDETFRNEPVNFHYTIKSTKKVVQVETLQNISLGVPKIVELIKGELETAEVPEEVKSMIPVLNREEKNVIIHDNQTGVSYKNLFGDYLIGASRFKSLTLISDYLSRQKT